MTPGDAAAVAIVTGGSFPVGRRVALALAGRGDAVALIYLEDQRYAEATVQQALGAPGTAIAVRAGLDDELDVERLFAETVAMFAGTDVLVHTTTEDPAVLVTQASQALRRGSAIISVARTTPMPAPLAERLRDREITIAEAAPPAGAPELLALVERWREGRA